MCNLQGFKVAQALKTSNLLKFLWRKRKRGGERKEKRGGRRKEEEDLVTRPCFLGM